MDTAYVPPMGLEVLLSPLATDAVQFTILKVGHGQASDKELRQHAQRDKLVVLQMGGRRRSVASSTRSTRAAEWEPGSFWPRRGSRQGMAAEAGPLRV